MPSAGNCIVLKPAEQTPTSIIVLMELLQDILPPGTTLYLQHYCMAAGLIIVYNCHHHCHHLLVSIGVLNVVTGTGLEAGKPLSESSRIAKIAFTGETSTGRIIMKAAAESLIPVTMELGGTTTATTKLLRLYVYPTLLICDDTCVGTMIVIEYTC